MHGGPVARRERQHARSNILLDELQVRRGHAAIEGLSKDRKTDRVAKLEAIQTRDRQWFVAGCGNAGNGRGRMSLLDVKAVEEAGIGVDAQYLPLFSARIARAAGAG